MFEKKNAWLKTRQLHLIAKPVKTPTGILQGKQMGLQLTWKETNVNSISKG
jgi:hypothetical protein